ncbi:ComEC/Rec2 family competence protein [Pedobacter sp. N23S346]|uniref:ComEC/Rec2 family competence protein n=1 Tax=Pedobacter sp. N23S346 TaxID=3402750 RepID=UPI003ACEC383
MFKEEYVFVRILIPLVAGISIFYFLHEDNLIFIISSIALFLFLAILSVNIYYKKLNAYRFKGLTGILIYLLCFLLGGLVCLTNNEKFKTDYFTKKKVDYLKIWVNDDPIKASGILRFKAKVVAGYQQARQIKLSGQILIAAKLDSIDPLKLEYGDELVIAAKYLPVEPPYNPAEFNFKHWLALQNIYEQSFINQTELFKTNQNLGNPLLKFALELRAQQVAKYRKLIKNDEAFAVASTLILGYRADLSKETLASYSKTGTIHALSVSGSHVAIVFFILDFLLMSLDKKKSFKVLKFILICLLIWSYALITGLSPSVVRSAIMITVFITAKTFAKNKNSYNTLACAAFCQLVYNPYLIWDVGFQLSYLSVLGLIYLQPKIYKWMYIENKWVNKIWELIALSIAAQIATFPLCIYYFHQFPVYFLLGNLFISIPLILILILGIAVLIPPIDLLSGIFEWIIVFTNQVLKWIGDLPYATFSSIWINLPELILLSISLVFFVFAMTKYNKRLLFLSLSSFIIYQLMIAYNSWEFTNQKKIIFFTLRKNYAAAFIQGNQTILLTDLNPEDKTFQFFIKPALDQAQVDSIKMISIKTNMLTMPHFILKDKQIIFDQYKILIIDSLFNNKRLAARGRFNAVWFTNNTKFKIEKLPKEIEYQNIIIDATNKDYKIDWFKKIAQNNKVPIQVLKKNPAYLIRLTE